MHYCEGVADIQRPVLPTVDSQAPTERYADVQLTVARLSRVTDRPNRG